MLFKPNKKYFSILEKREHNIDLNFDLIYRILICVFLIDFGKINALR